MKLAPILLFVYNRLAHTKKTINSLKKNHLASKSKIFIYSDGPKSKKDFEDVNKVRRYLKTVQGFKKITIIEKKNNLGLAKSIIKGVTEVVNKYGKIIALEDDLLTSRYFLNFMNSALEYYKDEKKIWHISGWNYPTRFKSDDGVYCYRLVNTWGWATWKNRWKHYEIKIEKTLNQFSKEEIKRFNLDGYNNNLWKQLLLNQKKKINTWAIFWYIVIFRNNGLCLNPTKSFVKNIGFDGSGVHTHDFRYKDNKFLNQNKNIKFKKITQEDNQNLKIIKGYLLNSKKNYMSKIFTRIKFFKKKLIL
jgi:hypothetical protein